MHCKPFQVGDGEDVRLLAATLQPWAVFLDFDRTLATTRGGGSPLVRLLARPPSLPPAIPLYLLFVLKLKVPFPLSRL